MKYYRWDVKTNKQINILNLLSSFLLLFRSTPKYRIDIQLLFQDVRSTPKYRVSQVDMQVLSQDPRLHIELILSQEVRSTPIYRVDLYLPLLS